MLRTSRQRHTLGRSCPVARVADLVGDSVVLLIIRDLLEGPRRFCELEASLEGVSTRTLASKLKFLEREKLVSRTGTSTAYRITKKGAAFHTVVDAMRAYGKKYL